ncbi:hypothetical protein SK128_006767 [Halocaridina rubra]|uniref:Uncharacterized protein n=1 Tax=Halocaridina rubra TaxID=373956 RepID=A0AAN9A7S6_HALRR
MIVYIVGHWRREERNSDEKGHHHLTYNNISHLPAISGCLRIFGPVAGMALSAYAVGKWVELGAKPAIDPSHPRWVGAWWLGYPIIILILFVTSVPMMMVPRLLPGMRERLVNKLRAAAKQGSEAFEEYRNTLRPIERTHFRGM